MVKIELLNEILLNQNVELEKQQNEFLDSSLGKVIDTGIEIGIRALAPDFVENQIIDIKDNLFNHGIIEGLNKTINDVIETGKNIIGIATGNFENISQIQNVLEEGGILDSISGLIDYSLEKLHDNGKLSSGILSLISNGKDILLNSTEKNIEDMFKEQSDILGKMNDDINKWEESYNERDFRSMEESYNILEENIKLLAPLEEVLNKYNEIKNVQEFLNNNGQNFDVSIEYLDLIKKI